MNYTKSLEEQNEELQKKLSQCQACRPRWIQDTREPPLWFADKANLWWYFVVGAETILASVHYVKDAKIDGYKICVLQTKLGWGASCNTTPEYFEKATTATLEEAQRYCEERIFNGE
jgi:hypothetical protein